MKRLTATAQSSGGVRRSERGVALLIVLLITALLIALVFEFAYGTRVSLRAAANFRDSQRAYFLARSGVNFAGKLLAENLKNGKLQSNLEQREWQIVPIISAGDAELRVRWEDEAGKINIANVRTGQASLNRLEKLFELKGIDLDILESIKAKQDIRMTTELYQIMNDEAFGKIENHVTVFGSNTVNINSASSEVLQSLGISSSLASLLIERRNREPFDAKDKVLSFPGMDTVDAAAKAALDVTSNIFSVESYATVGGYTKQAEAVILRSAAGFTVLSWKIL